MSKPLSIEDLLRSIEGLDRDGCKSRLRRLDGPRLDFTDEFLDGLSLERLRHLVLAAALQGRKQRRAT